MSDTTTTKRRLISNATSLVLLTLSNYFIGLLIFPYLSRVLSVEAFGLFGFSMAFVIIFQVVVEYGFMISATARIAQCRGNPARVGEIISTTMLAKFILVAVAVGGFMVVAQTIPMVRQHLLLVTLFLLSAIITALLPEYYFRGVERMSGIAARAILSKLAALIVIVVVVKDDAQLLFIPVALALGNSLALTLGFFAIHRSGVRMPVPRLRNALRELRWGAGFFASRVAASVNQMAGSFVLGLHFSPASAAMGRFVGASRIAAAGELAVIPISDSIYPHMVRTSDYRLFRRVYFGGLVLWLAGCLAVFIWAEIICVIILGESYAAAGGVLRVLVFGTFMAYSSNLFGYPALSPIGLAQHANLGLLISSCVTIAAYSILWFTDRITVESVSAVVATANLVVFLYRFIVFVANRRRIPHPPPS